MKGPLQLTETVTVKEAADMLGLSHCTVRKYVRIGKLPAVMIEGQYWIPVSVVEALTHENDQAA